MDNNKQHVIFFTLSASVEPNDFEPLMNYIEEHVHGVTEARCLHKKRRVCFAKTNGDRNPFDICTNLCNLKEVERANPSPDRRAL